MKTVDQIKSGLVNAEFYLEYLPTMDLANNHCVGAEALIRWLHHDEIIPPLDFIPAIEKTPLAGLITYWVIEEVARELGAWLGSNDHVHIGINVPPEIIGRGGLAYAAQKAGLMAMADKLIVEVTERGLPDKLALDALNSEGMPAKIAVDDFGTGDANLLQLSQFKVDIIKIDKVFVDQIEDENHVPKLIAGLTSFAKAAGMELIAEGIESPAQAKVLRDLGVQMGQGWFFSKSLRADAFLDYFSAKT